jgi:DNA-binding MarR family transcriptional regulator
MDMIVASIKSFHMTNRRSKRDIQSEHLGGLNVSTIPNLLTFNLNFLQIMMNRDLERRFESSELGHRYMGILLLIRDNPGVPQGRIARAVNLKRNSFVPIVDFMEHGGYVERRAHSSDSRSKGLWILPKGRRAINKLLQYSNQWDAEMFAGFTTAERETFRALVLRATQNLIELQQQG